MLGKRFHDVLPVSVADPLLDVTRRKTVDAAAPQDPRIPARDVRRTPVVRGAGRRRCEQSPGRDRSVVFIVARHHRPQARRRAAKARTSTCKEAFDADLHFGEIIGRSAAMQSVFEAIALVADTDSSVLLLGETGTGKELIARAIHRLSRRRSGPMVKVNCGALPATLVESELFGHERGAFTGAVQQRKGRFELAHRGTIFLDEVGELLARGAGQAAEGAAGAGVRARRRHPDAARRRPRGRGDQPRPGRRGAPRRVPRRTCYFRLNIFPIQVPPLRDRRDDIPLLAQHFVREFRAGMGRHDRAHRHPRARAPDRLRLAGQRA